VRAAGTGMDAGEGGTAAMGLAGGGTVSGGGGWGMGASEAAARAAGAGEGTASAGGGEGGCGGGGRGGRGLGASGGRGDGVPAGVTGSGGCAPVLDTDVRYERCNIPLPSSFGCLSIFPCFLVLVISRARSRTRAYTASWCHNPCRPAAPHGKCCRFAICRPPSLEHGERERAVRIAACVAWGSAGQLVVLRQLRHSSVRSKHGKWHPR
jgi:hypothetical protein